MEMNIYLLKRSKEELPVTLLQYPSFELKLCKVFDDL
jgi:hypothetical protein